MKDGNELKLLFGQKGETLCSHFFSLQRRFPEYVPQEMLKELARLLSHCSDAFLEIHEVSYLRKLFFSYYRLLKKQEQYSERRYLKILEISPSVYGIFFALPCLEEQETLTEECLLKSVQQLVPAIKPCAGSWLAFKRSSIQCIYLEIIKMRGGSFTKKEKHTLLEELPLALQQGSDPHTFFFPGNDEELFKNINLLSHELKCIQDQPQVMVSCIEYCQKTLKFLVIALRVVKPDALSIETLSSRLSSLTQFSLENVFCVGRIGKKSSKEAAIFTLEMNCVQFLRSNHGVDLRVVRQYVIKELESMLGSFRDYNGGLLTKENEQIVFAKRMLEKKGISFPLLEDFFYATKPITLRVIILPKTVVSFALLFQKMENMPLKNGQTYCLKSHCSSDVHLIIIKTKERGWKTALPKAILSRFPDAGHCCIEHKNHLYLSFFQQFPENDVMLKGIKQELLAVSSQKPRQQENILCLNFQCGDPPSLNPRLANDIHCHILANLLFEGLTRINEAGQVEPAAAEKIVISSCKKRYTFYLRDTFWSNGEELTAYHFERAWKKSLSANSKSCLYLSFFSPIKNANSAILESAPLTKVGISVPTPKVLSVELESPCPHFLNLVASPPFFPLFGTSEEPICFNGPFTLSEWKRDHMLYLSKNPFYRSAPQIKLRGIKISMIRDPFKAYKLFKSGQIDFIGDPISPLPPEYLKATRLQARLSCHTISRVYWIHCNMQVHPLHNVNIRRALSLCLDRDRLTRQVFIKQLPHASPLPPKYSCFPNTAKTALKDAQAAFDLGLAELNMTPHTFPELIYTHPDLPFEKALFEELKGQWETAFGITIHSKQLPWSEFSASLEKGNYQLGGLFRRDFYGHPFFFLNFFKKAPYNPHSLENEDYEKLLENYLHEENQQQAIVDLEHFLITHAPVIPLVNQNYLYAVNKCVKGLKFNESGCLNLMETYIDENS